MTAIESAVTSNLQRSSERDVSFKNTVCNYRTVNDTELKALLEDEDMAGELTPAGWCQVTIQHGVKYDKDMIIKVLLQAVSPLIFIPTLNKADNETKTAVFFADRKLFFANFLFPSSLASGPEDCL